MSRVVPSSIMSYGASPLGVESFTEIKPTFTKLLPNNQSSSQVYSPNGTNRIFFRIPSYSNTFLDTSRSFLQYEFKRNATADKTAADNVKMADWPGAWIQRIVVKAGNGLVISDCSNAHVLAKMFFLMKTSSDPRLNEGNYALLGSRNFIGGEQSEFTTYTLQFQWGLLSKHLGLCLPIGLMSDGGYALDFELYLASPQETLEMVGNPATSLPTGYEIQNISYHMCLLQLDHTLSDKYNRIVTGGDPVQIPYKTYVHHQSTHTGKAMTHYISEACSDIRRLYVAITDQSQAFGDKKTPWDFHGCANTTAASKKVIKWNFKIGTNHVFNEPVVETSKTNSETLSHIRNAHFLGKSEKSMLVERVDTLLEDKILPVFENGKSFMLGCTFEYSDESSKVSQGISTNGHPIHLELELGAAGTHSVHAFVELGYNLEIRNGRVTYSEVDTNKFSL